MEQTFKHTGVYDKHGVELYPGDIVKTGTHDVIEPFGSHLAGSFSYRPIGATNPTSSYPLYDLVKHRDIEIVGNSSHGKIDIRPIEKSDLFMVKEMDNRSDFQVFELLKDYEEDEFGNYAYGAFLNNKLIGYCTVGGGEYYAELEEYQPEDLNLSDVFIDKEYRGTHIGSIMVAKAIALESDSVNCNVFATILHDEHLHFYSDLGFTVVDKEAGIICRHKEKR